MGRDGVEARQAAGLGAVFRWSTLLTLAVLALTPSRALAKTPADHSSGGRKLESKHPTWADVSAGKVTSPFVGLDKVERSASAEVSEHNRRQLEAALAQLPELKSSSDLIARYHRFLQETPGAKRWPLDRLARSPRADLVRQFVTSSLWLAYLYSIAGPPGATIADAPISDAAGAAALAAWLKLDGAGGVVDQDDLPSRTAATRFLAKAATELLKEEPPPALRESLEELRRGRTSDLPSALIPWLVSKSVNGGLSPSAQKLAELIVAAAHFGDTAARSITVPGVPAFPADIAKQGQSLFKALQPPAGHATEARSASAKRASDMGAGIAARIALQKMGDAVHDAAVLMAKEESEAGDKREFFLAPTPAKFASWAGKLFDAGKVTGASLWKALTELAGVQTACGELSEASAAKNKACVAALNGSKAKEVAALALRVLERQGRVPSVAVKTTDGLLSTRTDLERELARIVAQARDKGHGVARDLPSYRFTGTSPAERAALGKWLEENRSFERMGGILDDLVHKHGLSDNSRRARADRDVIFSAMLAMQKQLSSAGTDDLRAPPGFQAVPAMKSVEDAQKAVRAAATYTDGWLTKLAGDPVTLADLRTARLDDLSRYLRGKSLHEVLGRSPTEDGNLSMQEKKRIRDLLLSAHKVVFDQIRAAYGKIPGKAAASFAEVTTEAPRAAILADMPSILSGEWPTHLEELARHRAAKNGVAHAKIEGATPQEKLKRARELATKAWGKADPATRTALEWLWTGLSQGPAHHPADGDRAIESALSATDFVRAKTPHFSTEMDGLVRATAPAANRAIGAALSAVLGKVADCGLGVSGRYEAGRASLTGLGDVLLPDAVGAPQPTPVPALLALAPALRAWDCTRLARFLQDPVDGIAVIGALAEDGALDPAVKEAYRGWLLAKAGELVPARRDATISAEAWSDLRRVIYAMHKLDGWSIPMRDLARAVSAIGGAVKEGKSIGFVHEGESKITRGVGSELVPIGDLFDDVRAVKGAHENNLTSRLIQLASGRHGAELTSRARARLLALDLSAGPFAIAAKSDPDSVARALAKAWATKSDAIEEQLALAHREPSRRDAARTEIHRLLLLHGELSPGALSPSSFVAKSPLDPRRGGKFDAKGWDAARRTRLALLEASLARLDEPKLTRAEIDRWMGEYLRAHGGLNLGDRDFIRRGLGLPGSPADEPATAAQRQIARAALLREKLALVVSDTPEGELKLNRRNRSTQPELALLEGAAESLSFQREATRLAKSDDQKAALDEFLRAHLGVAEHDGILLGELRAHARAVLEGMPGKAMSPEERGMLEGLNARAAAAEKAAQKQRELLAERFFGEACRGPGEAPYSNWSYLSLSRVVPGKEHDFLSSSPQFHVAVPADLVPQLGAGAYREMARREFQRMRAPAEYLHYWRDKRGLTEADAKAKWEEHETERFEQRHRFAAHIASKVAPLLHDKEEEERLSAVWSQCRTSDCLLGLVHYLNDGAGREEERFRNLRQTVNALAERLISAQPKGAIPGAEDTLRIDYRMLSVRDVGWTEEEKKLQADVARSGATKALADRVAGWREAGHTAYRNVQILVDALPWSSPLKRVVYAARFPEPVRATALGDGFLRFAAQAPERACEESWISHQSGQLADELRIDAFRGPRVGGDGSVGLLARIRRAVEKTLRDDQLGDFDLIGGGAEPKVDLNEGPLPEGKRRAREPKTIAGEVVKEVFRKSLGPIAGIGTAVERDRAIRARGSLARSLHEQLAQEPSSLEPVHLNVIDHIQPELMAAYQKLGEALAKGAQGAEMLKDLPEALRKEIEGAHGWRDASHAEKTRRLLDLRRALASQLAQIDELKLRDYPGLGHGPKGKSKDAYDDPWVLSAERAKSDWHRALAGLNGFRVAGGKYGDGDAEEMLVRGRASRLPRLSLSGYLRECQGAAIPLKGPGAARLADRDERMRKLGNPVGTYSTSDFLKRGGRDFLKAASFPPPDRPGVSRDAFRRPKTDSWREELGFAMYQRNRVPALEFPSRWSVDLPASSVQAVDGLRMPPAVTEALHFILEEATDWGVDEYGWLTCYTKDPFRKDELARLILNPSSAAIFQTMWKNPALRQKWIARTAGRAKGTIFDPGHELHTSIAKSSGWQALTKSVNERLGREPGTKMTVADLLAQLPHLSERDAETLRWVLKDIEGWAAREWEKRNRAARGGEAGWPNVADLQATRHLATLLYELPSELTLPSSHHHDPAYAGDASWSRWHRWQATDKDLKPVGPAPHESRYPDSLAGNLDGLSDEQKRAAEYYGRVLRQNGVFPPSQWYQRFRQFSDEDLARLSRLMGIHYGDKEQVRRLLLDATPASVAMALARRNHPRDRYATSHGGPADEARRIREYFLDPKTRGKEMDDATWDVFTRYARARILRDAMLRSGTATGGSLSEKDNERLTQLFSLMRAQLDSYGRDPKGHALRAAYRAFNTSVAELEALIAEARPGDPARPSLEARLTRLRESSPVLAQFLDMERGLREEAARELMAKESQGLRPGDLSLIERYLRKNAPATHLIIPRGDGTELKVDANHPAVKALGQVLGYRDHQGKATGLRGSTDAVRALGSRLSWEAQWCANQEGEPGGEKTRADVFLSDAEKAWSGWKAKEKTLIAEQKAIGKALRDLEQKQAEEGRKHSKRTSELIAEVKRLEREAQFLEGSLKQITREEAVLGLSLEEARRLKDWQLKEMALQYLRNPSLAEEKRRVYRIRRLHYEDNLRATRAKAARALALLDSKRSELVTLMEKRDRERAQFIREKIKDRPVTSMEQFLADDVAKGVGERYSGDPLRGERVREHQAQLLRFFQLRRRAEALARAMAEEESTPDEQGYRDVTGEKAKDNPVGFARFLRSRREGHLETAGWAEFSRFETDYESLCGVKKGAARELLQKLVREMQQRPGWTEARGQRRELARRLKEKWGVGIADGTFDFSRATLHKGKFEELEADLRAYSRATGPTSASSEVEAELALQGLLPGQDPAASLRALILAHAAEQGQTGWVQVPGHEGTAYWVTYDHDGSAKISTRRALADGKAEAGELAVLKQKATSGLEEIRDLLHGKYDSETKKREGSVFELFEKCREKSDSLRTDLRAVAELGQYLISVLSSGGMVPEPAAKTDGTSWLDKLDGGAAHTCNTLRSRLVELRSKVRELAPYGGLVVRLDAEGNDRPEAATVDYFLNKYALEVKYQQEVGLDVMNFEMSEARSARYRQYAMTAAIIAAQLATAGATSVLNAWLSSTLVAGRIAMVAQAASMGLRGLGGVLGHLSSAVQLHWWGYAMEEAMHMAGLTQHAPQLSKHETHLYSSMASFGVAGSLSHWKALHRLLGKQAAEMLTWGVGSGLTEGAWKYYVEGVPWELAAEHGVFNGLTMGGLHYKPKWLFNYDRVRWDISRYGLGAGHMLVFDQIMTEIRKRFGYDAEILREKLAEFERKGDGAGWWKAFLEPNRSIFASNWWMYAKMAGPGAVQAGRMHDIRRRLSHIGQIATPERLKDLGMADRTDLLGKPIEAKEIEAAIAKENPEHSLLGYLLGSAQRLFSSARPKNMSEAEWQAERGRELLFAALSHSPLHEIAEMAKQNPKLLPALAERFGIDPQRFEKALTAYLAGHAIEPTPPGEPRPGRLMEIARALAHGEGLNRREASLQDFLYEMRGKIASEIRAELQRLETLPVPRQGADRAAQERALQRRVELLNELSQVDPRWYELFPMEALGDLSHPFVQRAAKAFAEHRGFKPEALIAFLKTLELTPGTTWDAIDTLYRQKALASFGQLAAEIERGDTGHAAIVALHGIRGLRRVADKVGDTGLRRELKEIADWLEKLETTSLSENALGRLTVAELAGAKPETVKALLEKLARRHGVRAKDLEAHVEAVKLAGRAGRESLLGLVRDIQIPDGPGPGAPVSRRAGYAWLKMLFPEVAQSRVLKNLPWDIEHSTDSPVAAVGTAEMTVVAGGSRRKVQVLLLPDGAIAVRLDVPSAESAGAAAAVRRSAGRLGVPDIRTEPGVTGRTVLQILVPLGQNRGNAVTFLESMHRVLHGPLGPTLSGPAAGR